MLSIAFSFISCTELNTFSSSLLQKKKNNHQIKQSNSSLVYFANFIWKRAQPQKSLLINFERNKFFVACKWKSNLKKLIKQHSKLCAVFKRHCRSCYNINQINKKPSTFSVSNCMPSNELNSANSKPILKLDQLKINYCY